MLVTGSQWLPCRWYDWKNKLMDGREGHIFLTLAIPAVGTGCKQI